MKMSGENLQSKFDQIYQIDLEYQPACWKLCGDGHCCHHTRYRDNIRGVQILPLMPGELAYMQERGLLKQYSNPKITSERFEFNFGPIQFDQLQVDLKNGGCPCIHGMRPTICRLYPVLPIFDPQQGIVGFDDKFTIYEEGEAFYKLPQACKITSVPFSQLNQFNSFLKVLASEPLFMFYLTVYRALKQAFVNELKLVATPPNDANKEIASGIDRGSRSLIFKLRTKRAPEVIDQIHTIASQYKNHFGDRLRFDF